MGQSVLAVAFDYGGVLTTSMATTFGAWVRADRIDPDSVTEALRTWLADDAPADNPVHQLEIGALPHAEFAALLAAELRTVDGGRVDPDGLLDRIFAELHLDPLMLELVGSLRARGVATALLSNSWGNTYPMEILEPLFDVVVISGEVGLRKPDSAIFHHLLDALRIPAPRCAFVDDLRPNVDAAAALGMHAILHLDAASTADALTDLIRPPEEKPHA